MPRVFRSQSNRVFTLLPAVWVLSILFFHLTSVAIAQDANVELMETANENKAMLKSLLGQLELLKWGVGLVVTALITCIGLLFRELLAAKSEIVSMAKVAADQRVAAAEREAAHRSEQASAATTALVTATARIDRLVDEVKDMGAKLHDIAKKVA